MRTILALCTSLVKPFFRRTRAVEEGADLAALESSTWREVAESMVGSQAVPEESQAAMDLVSGLFAEAPLNASEHTLAFALGVSLRRLPDSREQIFTFHEFVSMPLCRWIPQIHRLEAFLLYLRDPDAMLEGRSAPLDARTVFEHGPTSNVHGNFLWELLAASGKGARRCKPPTPAFPSTGIVEDALKKSDLYLEHLGLVCVQH